MCATCSWAPRRPAAAWRPRRCASPQASASVPSSMRTLAILPVKSFSQAKQRLSHELAPAVREALAEAMLEDVLESLARCAGLDGLLVVSPGYRARELAEQAGASTISDEEHGHNDAAGLGISAALEHGAERVLL